MIKSIASLFALSLTIYSLLFVSFTKNETIDLSKYSTEGLVYNYTVNQDGNLIGDFIASNDTKNEFFTLFR